MTLHQLAEKYKPHHNELCLLYDTEMVRLIGVGQDDQDLYYIVQKMGYNGKNNDHISWSTAVGRILPLKGIIPEYSYKRADSVHTFNGCGPTKNFLVEDDSIWDTKNSNLEKRITHCGQFLMTYNKAKPEERFSLWRCYPREDLDPALIMTGEIAPLEQVTRAILRPE